jgi:hypothetical protein
MSNVDQALQRPANFYELSGEEQWAIDKSLGLLDWIPTLEEIAEFARRNKEAGADK